MPFITFEGGEGCGKTTQSKLLYEALINSGIEVVLTREPGGTPAAELLRQLLIEGAAEKWDQKTELLLHMAARKEHVEKLIKPALAANKIVICDRFLDSSLAYQGYGQGVDLETINILHKLIIGDLYPDLTVILDIDGAIGIERAKARNQAINNRYENMDIGFHQRVRQGFQEIANNNPTRCVIIKADVSLHDIHVKIIQMVNKLFDFNIKNFCT